MYEHVFELLLRLKGNYLWPAMWRPKAFNDDDPQSMVLADAMGVVMGTSHHEPMMRAHDEWHRHTEQGVTGGKWDYSTNAANLRKFWQGGIERMMSKGGGQAYESVVTIGMRGDGDEAMTGARRSSLLETIVADQRRIIAAVTGKPAAQTPQVWALYKEVQDYYDRGMQVPDDVILLFADDNWGQIRRLPTPDVQRQRRLRRLLSLRLCRRAAQLQVAQHRPDRKDLAADGSRVGARRQEPVDRQRRATSSRWSSR